MAPVLKEAPVRVRPHLLVAIMTALLLAGWPPSRLSLAQPPTHWLYLPIAARPGGCTPSAQEQRIADLMRAHPNQQRPALTCDPILEQVARARAQDMADRAYFSHTNPDGLGPNTLVRQAGYPLPGWYSTALDGNNIESIAAGPSTADATWNLWMNSPGHSLHLLGLDPFWAEQIEYGIGFVAKPGSPYTYYWVAITAKREP